MTAPLTLLSSLLAGEASVWVKRIRRNAVFLGLSAVLGISAYALVLVATVLAIARSQGAVMACVAVAAVLAATALVLLATMSVVDRREKRRQAQSDSRTALYATSAAVALPMMMQSRKIMALAAVAGIAYGIARLSGTTASSRT